MANKAFMKAAMAKHDIDEALEAVVGRGPISRPQATKKIWAYIKRRRGVQEGRKIHLHKDANLAALSRKKTVTMFELPGIINSHIV